MSPPPIIDTDDNLGELLPPPEIGSTFRQAWEDYRAQLDELVKVSGEVLKPVVAWYKQYQTEENKKLTVDYLRWRQDLITYAREISESDIVAPTDEIIARIGAYRKAFLEWVTKFREMKILTAPITLSEPPKDDPKSTTWTFIKWGVAGGLVILGISAVADLVHAVKDKDGGKKNE